MQKRLLALLPAFALLLLACNLAELVLSDTSPTDNSLPTSAPEDRLDIPIQDPEMATESAVVQATAIATNAPKPSVPDVAPADLAGYEILDVQPTAYPAVYTDTALQTTVFDEFWSLIMTEHVYRQQLAPQLAPLKAQYDAQISAGLNNAEFWALLTEITYQLNDEHSYLVSADKAEGVRNLLRGDAGYAGIGVALIGQPENDSALVGWAIPNNAAWNAGLRNGDRIIAVNGYRLCCAPNGEAFDFISGPAGTTIDLLVQKPDGTLQERTVTRSPIEVQDAIVTNRFGDTGYIQINTFLDRDIDDKFAAAWASLNANQDLTGLVIDLRTNTGGLIIQSNAILSYFVDGDLFWYYEPYIEKGNLVPRNMAGQDVLGSQSIPLAVLVSSATNSMGERFAGFLHDNQRSQALTIGTTTHANIEEITPFNLADGSILYLATDTIWPISGDWEETGVPIDIPVSFDWQHLGDPNLDAALQTAIQQLP